MVSRKKKKRIALKACINNAFLVFEALSGICYDAITVDIVYRTVITQATGLDIFFQTMNTAISHVKSANIIFGLKRTKGTFGLRRWRKKSSHRVQLGNV